MARPPPSEDADREQHEERDPEQHDGHRRRADRVVALDLTEDVDRRQLGVERDVAGHAPDRMAGTRLGRTTRRKVVVEDAPSEAAASSISRSSSCTTGWTERTTNGSVTNSSAIRIAHVVAMA